MTKIQIDGDIYKWLIAINILNPEQKFKQVYGKYELDDATSKNLQTGIMVSQILQKVGPLLTAQPFQSQQLQTLKQNNLPSTRLYNWNVISEIMKKLGINIDPDIKSQIVQGDSEIINEYLKDLYDSISSMIEKISGTSSRINSSNNSDINKKQKSQQDLDLTQIDVKKNLVQCDSILEMVIISLSRHLEIKTKHTITLLANGNKYLAHVLVKGMKGSYEQLVNWLQEMYASCNRIIELMKRDESQIVMFLQILKPGLLSKDQEVSIWSCRVITNISYQLADGQLLTQVWEWYCKENGGLQVCILSIQRHPDIVDNIASIMVQVGRFNFCELLTVQLKKQVPDVKQYLQICRQLLKPFTDTQLSRDQLLETGVIQNWFDICLNSSSNDYNNSNDIRIISLAFMVELWQQYAQFVEEQDNLSINIMNMMKLAVRDNSQTLQINAINLYFHLLEICANQQNPYSTIIYKMLTFFLIEKHADAEIREIILVNFINIFDKFSSIPTNIMLEPLLKQLQNKQNQTYVINTFDLDFLQAAAKHEQTDCDLSIQLMDEIVQMYITNYILSNSIRKIMLQVIQKNITDPIFRKYLQKLINKLMNIFVTNEKQLKQLKQPKSIKSSGDQIILLKQKRALILDLINIILDQNNQECNQIIKEIVLSTNKILIENKLFNKGFKQLRDQFGHADDDEEQDEQLDQSEEQFEQKMEKQVSDKKIIIPQKSDKDENSQQIKFQQKDRQLVTENNKNNINQQKIIDKTLKNDFEKNNQGINQLQSNQNMQENKNLRTNQFQTNQVKQREEKSHNNKDREKINSAQQSDNREIRSPKRKVTKTSQLKVLQDIEKIKQKRLEEMLKKQIEEEEAKIKQQQLINEARNKIKREKSVDVNQLIQEPVKKPQFRNFDFELCDFLNDEIRENQSMQAMVQKYKKTFVFLFKKYFNSINHDIVKKDTDFSSLQIKTSELSNADILLFCRDSDLTQSLSSQQINDLLKKILGKKESLNQKEFENFLQQACYLIYNIKNGSGDPIGVSFEQMLQKISNSLKVKKGILIEDFVQQENKQLINLNNQLLEDPNVELPEKYKTYQEKQINMVFELPQKLAQQIKPFADCYDIINEVLTNVFKMNLYESQTTFDIITKAKIKPIIVNNVPKPPLQKIDEQQSEQNEVKKLIVKNRLGSRSPSIQNNNLNKIQLDKLNQEKLDQQKKEQQQQLFIKRQEETKLKLKLLKEQKQQEENAKLEEEKQKLEEEALKKQKEKYKIMLEQEQRKLLIKKKAQEKQEQEKQKVLDSLQEKLLDKKNRKNSQKKFLEKQSEQLKQEFEKKKQIREAEEQQKLQQEKQEELIKQIVRKNLEQGHMKNIEKKEKDQIHRENLLQEFNTQEIQQNFENYEWQLSYIFQHYVNISGKAFDKNLQFKGFYLFTHSHNLNELFTTEQVKKIYNNYLSTNENSNNGLNYQQFKFLIFLMADKAQSRLTGDTHNEYLINLLNKLDIKHDKKTLTSKLNALNNERMSNKNQNSNINSQNITSSHVRSKSKNNLNFNNNSQQQLLNNSNHQNYDEQDQNQKQIVEIL